MAEGKSENKGKIRYEKIADMGAGLIIAKVPAECIREQDINARIMKNEMQRQLTDNIRKRGQLESLPLCALTQDGNRIEIISGHHRIRSGKDAGMQEAGYGWNRWKYSAARQWLNSDQPKGKWWTKQDDWDIAPNQLAQKDGFLCGMPAEMVAVLKPIKAITLANNVNDGGATDVTYDKVFLASMSQMNVNMSKDEGTVHEYWKRRTGSSKPIEPWKKYPCMIRYSAASHTSPQYVFSRSAIQGTASDVMNTTADGHVNSTCAWNAITYAPLVFI